MTRLQYFGLHRVPGRSLLFGGHYAGDGDLRSHEPATPCQANLSSRLHRIRKLNGHRARGLALPASAQGMPGALAGAVTASTVNGQPLLYGKGYYSRGMTYGRGFIVCRPGIVAFLPTEPMHHRVIRI